jgi:hypothetical protein
MGYQLLAGEGIPMEMATTENRRWGPMGQKEH